MREMITICLCHVRLEKLPKVLMICVQWFQLLMELRQGMFVTLYGR